MAVVHGRGSVRGPGGPENTHCTHIGAVHRKGIYPALEKWFGMPVPTEYSNRRPAADLLCWTDAAVNELHPSKLHEVLRERARAVEDTGAGQFFFPSMFGPWIERIFWILIREHLD